MTKVLIASPYTDAHKERLAAVFSGCDLVFADVRDTAQVLEEVQSAQVLISKSFARPAHLESPALRWIHCNQSGLDRCARPVFIDSDVQISSAAGRSSESLAEHALFFMLSHSCNAPDTFRARARHAWGLRDMPVTRGLNGQQALVIGMGNTARALIPRLQALDMAVEVFRRRNIKDDAPPGVPVWSQEAGDSLIEALGRADYIILAASLNNSSYHMLDAAAFRAMKPTAFISNVARAPILERAAFMKALKTRQIAGAGTDVTEPEPLPPWDPFWRLPNVMITPHITPQVSDRAAREIDIIAENWKRFSDGRPMKNLLTAEDRFDHTHWAQYSNAERLAWRVWNRLLKPRMRYGTPAGGI